ncbi:MAG: hypothetical protein ACP5QG_08065 [candidate division WOR-3 bacterium]
MTVLIFAQFQVLIPPTAHAPTIDGILSAGEWNTAAMIDISDTLGVDGNAERPGDCLVYAMHDVFYLYLAFDCRKDTMLSDHSQPSVAFDDDNSGTWPAEDTTEGVNVLGSDNGWFCSWWKEDFGWSGWYPSGLVIYSFSASTGHVVCEWVIPFLYPISDSGPQFIGTKAVAVQEDTIGVHLFYADAREGLIGYWPQDLARWYDPSGYGDFILLPGGDVAEREAESSGFMVVPSVARAGFSLSLFLPHQSAVSLSLYSATGSLVAEIFRGTLGPGSHVLAVPEQPSGAFFLRAELGERVLNQRIVVIR